MRQVLQGNPRVLTEIRFPSSRDRLPAREVAADWRSCGDVVGVCSVKNWNRFLFAMF